MSKVFSSFRSELEEKTLTPAEKKKREEVAKAIERENPKMPMGMKMAIATKTAKRVAEEVEQVDELKKSTVVNYLHKTVDPIYGLPKAKAKLAQRIKGIQRAHERIVGNKPTSSVKEAVDDEGAMAKGQLMRMVNQASGLARIMNDDTQLDGWVQSKLTLASDYLDSVHDFLMHSKQDVEDDEESEMQKEEVEQVDELNKSTVDSYLKKAVDPAYGDFGRRPKTKTKLAQRIKGIHNAHIRMLGIKPTSSVKEDVHYCAKHVRSHLLGDGVVLEAQHADPNDEGQIEWYMVEFKDGIHKVFTDDLEIMIAEYHGNHKKKKRMKDG